MTNKITTANIADLLDIFDPKVQETDNAGGARILYTFDEDKQPVRERVGETFIIDVLEPSISFFVSLPIEGAISSGNIMPATIIDGAADRYSLDPKELKQLIFDICVSLDYDESAINELLEQ